MIENSVYTLLSSIAPTFPMIANDGQSTPYITYQNILNKPVVAMAGNIPVNNTRIQIDCYAATYAAVRALAESIQSAMQSAPFVNVPQQTRDIYESEVKFYRVMMDYSIWY